MDLFTDEMRRDPYPVYDVLRRTGPVFKVPPPFDAWLVLDYDGVRGMLADHATFSSRVPAPKNWFLFSDPPQHTKLRGLISRAFTPRMVVELEPRVRAISRQLLDAVLDRGEMDLAGDFAVPLPMMVIAEMIGLPTEQWPRFKRWSDAILTLSYTRSGGAAAEQGMANFIAATDEMRAYLTDTLYRRTESAPSAGLLSRLAAAEVDGQRLTHDEILGFLQLLVVGGQETTTNLVNNAVLSLLENPAQLARVVSDRTLLPSAIEETLRYRAPFQWLMRTPTRDVELHGQTLPAGRLILAMVGAANRDPARFPDPDRFDVTRDPNPHIAFGHGNHFCLGAALARLEARVALGDLLDRTRDLARTTDDPWEPRKALQVLGPARLPVRFTPA
jgi:cytochrome P450